MNVPRGVSQDELLTWIEQDADPARLGDIGARLAQDPELQAWAAAARADRDAIAALARAETRDAPTGLWQEALREAERRALLLENEIAPAVETRGPFRLRVTPARLVAAAAFLIVASLGAIAPLILNPQTPETVAFTPQPEESFVAPGPRQLTTESRGLALADASPEPPAPRALLASSSRDWAADPNGIVANRAAAGLGFHNMSVMEPARRDLPGAYPHSWGMTAADAQRFASEGRLTVAVSAQDADAYVARLLAAMGRRAAIDHAGLPADANGLASPTALTLSVSPDKLERALRLCAIEARELHLTADPAVGTPGDWAARHLWWAAGDARPALRVLVTQR